MREAKSYITTPTERMRRASSSRSRFPEMDFVILCGGLGTRLRTTLPNMPKALAPIAGTPFLDILLHHLFKAGFKRIILAVGHLQNPIISRYGNDSRILFAKEREPLGTGGAVRNARRLIKSPHFFVANGDTFSDADYQNFFTVHKTKGGIVTMGITRAGRRTDAGNILTDASGRILSFKEKRGARSRSGISAGLYCMRREVFDVMPKRKRFSLEEEVFSSLARQGVLFGVPIKREAIDIGTPARYARAKRILKKHRPSSLR